MLILIIGILEYFHNNIFEEGDYFIILTIIMRAMMFGGKF
ncbi:hypothetical protein RAMDARK_0403 [Rickettsia amblyommatis str. Darkwater]|nr:hypothetical protein RAMDARK_0403 [Rickettsia amblyommatis str. Darkwater]